LFLQLQLALKQQDLMGQMRELGECVILKPTLKPTLPVHNMHKRDIAAGSDSTYSWFFTTNSIGPRVVENCNRTVGCGFNQISSPTPFSRVGTDMSGAGVSNRIDDGEVSVNIAIAARFTTDMQELSLMIDHFLWGRISLGFHLTNILLHALCALFLYILSLKIFKNWMVAFITASLFGIHPINTEAVTYVAGRADSLYLLFFLISFILFLRIVEALKGDKKIRYVSYALSIFFYALSMISKEIGMILPLFFILYMFTFLNRHERAKLCSLIVPYVIVFLVYVIMRKTILDFSGVAPSTIMAKFNLYIRMLTTCKAICIYLFLLVVPFGLHMERKVKVATSFFSPEVFAAVVVISAIVLLIYLFHKRSRKSIFACLWFFTGLFPVSNIVPINSFIAEHWLYLPAIGVYMIIGLTGAYFFYKPLQNSASSAIKALVIFSLACLFLFFSVLTFERNKDWKDGVTFFKNTLKYSPNNARLHLNFGNVYSHNGQDEDAMREYKKALELQPTYAEAYSNIASIYISQGNYKMARQYLEKALSLKPNFPHAQEMMSMIKERKGS